MCGSLGLLALIPLGMTLECVPVEAVKPSAAVPGAATTVEDLIVTSGTVTFETIDYLSDEKPDVPVLGTETLRYALFAACGTHRAPSTVTS